MPVPKHRKSKSKQRMRRAQQKLTAPALARCPRCRQLRRPHHACTNCGHYQGRQVMEPAAP